MTFPTAYFAPILQYALQSTQSSYDLEVKEHFTKQSYRSRCEIYGANGILKLIVPLKKWKSGSKTESIEISYDENWPLLHWKSITAAYRSSPYFEFYEDELIEIFQKKFRFLVNLNQYAEKQISTMIQLPLRAKKTKSFQKVSSPDLRLQIHPKSDSFVNQFQFPTYNQVFSPKFGFIKNLSILDLLFNLGPESLNYLKNIGAQYGKKN